jgi:membrane dipeptidase
VGLIGAIDMPQPTSTGVAIAAAAPGHAGQRLRLARAMSVLLALGGCHSTAPRMQQDEIPARVAALLRTTPLVDGHNDLHIHYHACKAGCPRGFDAYDISGRVEGHTDLPRWREGQVGAQLLNSGWIDAEPGLDGTLKGFAFTREMAQRYARSIVVARTASEVRAAHAGGRLAILLALEDMDRLGTDAATVQRLASEGLRSDILAYSGPSLLADGHAGPARFGGLSPLGRQMVGWMKDNGILVDLSHASADTARDVLAQAAAPVIFSHSSAAALCDVPRNVPDDVLQRLRANGGIVMVSFVPEFTRKEFADWYDAGDAYWTALLKANGGDRAQAGPAMDQWEKDHPRPLVTVPDVADHVEHIRDVAGIDHVGFGSDFDGIDFTVTGLEDVSTFPRLLEELARRGWSNEDLRKVAGENFLRVLDTADAVAQSRRQGALERAPSAATRR